MDERFRNLTRMWMSAQPLVASFVASVVRDFSAQDDIMQDIITAVIESFDSYDPERPFVGWVLGIARNQIGHYRRKSFRDRCHFDEFTVDLLQNTFAQMAAKELRALESLRDCMEKLNERDRRLCDLRYEQDLKPAGIASILGVTANTAAKALQRVRDQLRTCIERKMGEAERPL